MTARQHFACLVRIRFELHFSGFRFSFVQIPTMARDANKCSSGQAVRLSSSVSKQLYAVECFRAHIDWAGHSTIFIVMLPSPDSLSRMHLLNLRRSVGGLEPTHHGIEHSEGLGIVVGSVLVCDS